MSIGGLQSGMGHFVSDGCDLRATPLELAIAAIQVIAKISYRVEYRTRPMSSKGCVHRPQASMESQARHSPVSAVSSLSYRLGGNLIEKQIEARRFRASPVFQSKC